MSKLLQFIAPTEARMQAFAEGLAKAFLGSDNGVPASGFKLYLSGNLGAGKTTFSRFFLQALGVQGSVKSPTYAIIEPYSVAGLSLLHIDLYRISAHELYDLGFLEEQDALWLIEWPEKAEGLLPEPDILLVFDHQQDVTITIMPKSDFGRGLVTQLSLA